MEAEPVDVPRRWLSRPYTLRGLVVAAALVLAAVATAGWWLPYLLWWSWFRWQWHDGPAIALDGGDQVRFGADEFPGMFAGTDCPGGAAYTFLFWRRDGRERVFLARAACGSVSKEFGLRGSAGAERLWVVEEPDAPDARAIATLDRRTGEFRSLLDLEQDWSTRRWQRRRRQQEDLCHCVEGPDDPPLPPTVAPSWATLKGGKLLLSFPVPP